MAWTIQESDLDLEDAEEYDDEAVRTLLEEYDDEDWVRDEEAFAEARRPRYRRGSVASKFLRPGGRVTGVTSGRVRTPAGDANFRLAKPVATKESVEKLAQELRAAIKRIDQALDKNTSMLDKKVTAVEATLKKGQQQSSQAMLLPLLLSKPPQLDKIKVATPPAGTELPPGLRAGTEIPIDTTTYKKDDNFALLFMLMAMTGGMGGNSSDSNNMMLMALAVSGALGK